MDPSHIQTKHTLYMLMSNAFPDISNDELCYMIEGISSMLAIYFNYIATSTKHPEFLQRIIDRYMSGTLGSQTPDDFEVEFNAWVNKDPEEPVSPSPIRIPKSVLVHGGGFRKTRKLRI